MYCKENAKRSGILRQVRSYGTLAVWVLLGLWICVNLILANKKGTSVTFSDAMGHPEGDVLSRHKRFIYMDSTRRLRLPTGTILAFSGVISLPFLGNLPIGYGSGLTVAIPLTIKFDDLGLTSPENRFGYFDFLNGTDNFPRLNRLNFSNFGLPAFLVPDGFPASFSATLGKLLFTSRGKRSADWRNFPGVNYAGGDREMVFQIVEDFISNFGLDGHSCVLRTICEMHEEPLFNYGFFGEVLELLLSPSLAAYAEHRLAPYLQAEKQGKEKKKCVNYRSKCKYSLFSPMELQGRERRHRNVTDDEKESYVYNSVFKETGLSTMPRHRQKRFFAFGPQRRLIFPPTTAVVVTTTFNLPFLRDLPDGYKSQLSYSVPLNLDFDLLGLTSALNLFGNIPFLKKRKKREVEDALEGISYAGGDRELMYAVVVNSLSSIGMDGEACLRRVICEIHEMPLVNHGLFGEILSLFLTPSLAPRAQERLVEFVKAEQIGRKCGSCTIYSQKCPWSLFTNPGAGVKYRNEKELRECKRRTAFEYREENMDFVTSFRSKYKQVKKNLKPSVQFINEVAHKINMKALFQNF